MYLKKTPTSETKTIVTEEQAKDIERQWERHYEEGALEQRLSSDPEYGREYERVKADLEAKRGTEPSAGDIRWALANKQLLRHARRQDWGLYRNVKHNMASQLKAENKLKQALLTYLEICYLDMNGPNNLGGMGDPDMLKKYPPFDPVTGLLAPGVVWEVRELSDDLGLHPGDVKSLFIEIAVRNHKKLPLPIDPAQGWDMMSRSDAFATEEELEEARLAHGADYDLLGVAEARLKKLESSGAGLEQYDEALSMLEAALASPTSPYYQAMVHRRIGEIQHKFGRDEDAIQHLEAAMRLNPKVGVKRLLDRLRQTQQTRPSNTE